MDRLAACVLAAARTHLVRVRALVDLPIGCFLILQAALVPSSRLRRAILSTRARTSARQGLAPGVRFHLNAG